MRLEDTIKQTKPFKSELQKLLLNISVTSSWINTLISERLKVYDLTPHQYNVLRILNGKHPEGYCNHEITERMIDKSSNSTRIVDKLINKKLVIRKQELTDRRQVNIRISEEGRALLDQVEKAGFPIAEKLSQFNEEKMRLMNDWLDELRS
jgi:DNA-binding MarR family transcriptional regulator